MVFDNLKTIEFGVKLNTELATNPRVQHLRYQDTTLVPI